MNCFYEYSYVEPRIDYHRIYNSLHGDILIFCMYLKYSNLDVLEPILSIKTSNFR